MSYKQQPHRPGLTLADFDGHHRGLIEQNKGRSNIRDVRLVDVRERTVEGVRVMQVSREVDWASGNTTFSIEARLIGPKNSYSLVSDSPGRDWTHNNFEGFLPRLVDITLIEF